VPDFGGERAVAGGCGCDAVAPGIDESLRERAGRDARWGDADDRAGEENFGRDGDAESGGETGAVCFGAGGGYGSGNSAADFGQDFRPVVHDEGMWQMNGAWLVDGFVLRSRARRCCD